MSSQPSETYTARLLRNIRNGELRKNLVLGVVPIDGLEIAREQVSNLFAGVYSEVDELQNAFSDKDNPKLRKWAVKPYSDIPEYDPHETVTALLSFPSKVMSRLKQVLIVLAAVGSILSANRLYSVMMEGISLLGALEGLIPLSVTAVVIVYLWFLRTDSFVHQTLAEELRAGRAKVATRQRSQIVGYGVWNRSLFGQAGLFLVGFFYLLNSLPELPIVHRWFNDPSEYLTRIITENVDIFYETDSVTNAIWKLYRRMR